MERFRSMLVCARPGWIAPSRPRLGRMLLQRVLVGSTNLYVEPDLSVGGRGSPLTTVRSGPAPPRGPSILYCPDLGAGIPGFKGANVTHSYWLEFLTFGSYHGVARLPFRLLPRQATEAPKGGTEMCRPFRIERGRNNQEDFSGKPVQCRLYEVAERLSTENFQNCLCCDFPSI